MVYAELINGNTGRTHATSSTSTTLGDPETKVSLIAERLKNLYSSERGKTSIALFNYNFTTRSSVIIYPEQTRGDLTLQDLSEQETQPMRLTFYSNSFYAPVMITSDQREEGDRGANTAKLVHRNSDGDLPRNSTTKTVSPRLLSSVASAGMRQQRRNHTMDLVGPGG